MLPCFSYFSKINHMASIYKLSADGLYLALALLQQYHLPVEDLSPKTELFGAEEENRTVGSIGVEFYEGGALLRSLAVTEEKRGTGLGKELVQFIEQYARERQSGDIYLLTTTAAPFFQKRGYQVIERDSVPEELKKSSEFASVCPLSTTVLKKKLG